MMGIAAIRAFTPVFDGLWRLNPSYIGCIMAGRLARHDLGRSRQGTFRRAVVALNDGLAFAGFAP
jgi:hypothetical protein